MNTVIGKVKEVGETVTFASGFSKRTLVVTTDDKYPQDIPVDFVKEKGEKLDGLAAGQDVEVFYNLRGSEYKGKYYVSLDGWKLEKVGAGQATSTGAASTPTPSAPPADDFEDSPF